MPKPEAGGRVIAGAARGVRLAGSRAGTRPLTDRVKQALFAALEADGALEGPFLDLFAGSGAGGIEALSRGAPGATFVEHDVHACASIRDNLAGSALAGASVVCADALGYLRAGLPAGAQAFGCCLADPPYDEQLLGPALALLGNRSLGWLAKHAVVVGKHFWRSSAPPLVGDLKLARQRRFGETMLSFYAWQEGT
jgi:16S rRNA (guanine966-N2)-methyltransferase